MVSVRVKGPKTWHTQENFCLGISLASRNHEGEALKAMVAWLNDNRYAPETGLGFKQGVVDFSNTLHRYNYEIEGLHSKMTRKQAIDRTMEVSNAWFAQNAAILDQIAIPHQVIHWNQWLMDDRFIGYKKQFDDAYKAGGPFQDAIREDIHRYLKRRFGADTRLEDASSAVMELSVSFLLEELAAHSILYEDFPCAVIYPGRQQKSFQMVRQGLVPHVPTGMQNSHHTRLVLHDIDTPANTALVAPHSPRIRRAPVFG